MTESLLTRRRALMITAAAAGSAVLAAGGQARAPYEWRGTALGADGKILIDGFDRAKSRQIIALTLGEVERLERIFSLYRPDSEVSQLNRAGRLNHPSHDMRILLDRALYYWRATDGAFSPAVQPLWLLLAEHFAADPSAADPDADLLKETASQCDAGRIRIADDSISLAPGMALTFNGIAQGYITDAVAGLLRNEGLEDVLVQLGELRALPGRAWRVEIKGSGKETELVNGAIATSEPAGSPLTADRRWHHLIDPRTGYSADGLAGISVAAPGACLADALSTALAVSGLPAISTITSKFPEISILAQTADGRILTAGSGGIAFVSS